MFSYKNNLYTHRNFIVIDENKKDEKFDNNNCLLIHTFMYTYRYIYMYYIKDGERKKKKRKKQKNQSVHTVGSYFLVHSNLTQFGRDNLDCADDTKRDRYIEKEIKK